MKTRSEEFLALLGKKTFLSLWAIPNPFRDTVDPRLPGKEICDLLVVFGEDVIIFSDKEISYCRDKPLEVAWPRWYRKAVLESAAQLFGARDWLMENPERVFTDPNCAHRLALPIPSPDRIRFHLVVVARGIAQACAEHFGERGTLMQTNSDSPDQLPFTTFQPDPRRGFVHVLDEISLEFVLEHLDTTADLVEYLTAKERFFRRPRAISICGEEDALAMYFSNPVSKIGYDFPTLDGEDNALAMCFAGGYWDEFVETTAYTDWRADVDASRVWDEFVERCIYFSPHGPETWDKDITPETSEILLRMLASTSRIERRFMSAKVVEMITDPNLSRPGMLRRSYCSPLKPGHPHFTFLVMQAEGDHPWKANYREARREMLQAQMTVVRAMDSAVTDLVGIGLNAATDRNAGEDYVYLDGREWSDEMQLEALRTQKELQIFTNHTKEELSIRDFQRVQRRTPAPPDRVPWERNRRCFCGSGRMYKNCCLKKGIPPPLRRRRASEQ